MEVQQAFGLAHLWQQSDLVIKAVAFALVAMSVATWYLILAGLLRQRRMDRTAKAETSFWQAPDCARGLAELERATPDGALLALAREGVAAQTHVEAHAGRLRGGTAQAESLVSSALQKARLLVALRLESGQTTLASIGSSAPFVGLFGTVWGIYRALIGIGASGVATLDTVAGPVGEALIMTAFGLFVAIPAVLAFNGFGRTNRVELARLDAAAHDLHVWLATGARIAAAPPQRAATTRDAGVRSSIATVPAGTATPAGSE